MSRMILCNHEKSSALAQLMKMCGYLICSFIHLSWLSCVNTATSVSLNSQLAVTERLMNSCSRPARVTIVSCATVPPFAGRERRMICSLTLTNDFRFSSNHFIIWYFTSSSPHQRRVRSFKCNIHSLPERERIQNSTLPPLCCCVHRAMINHLPVALYACLLCFCPFCLSFVCM